MTELLPLDKGWTLLDGLYREARNQRIRIVKWWDFNPPTGRVVAPIVIAGAYRTGTTFLHRLLATAMPEYRTLLGWEASIPTPPPSNNMYARLRDSRCAQHQEGIDALYAIDPELRDMHYEPADLPAECVQVMAQTGLTGLWPAICACPDYVDYLLSEDAQTSSVGAYEYYDACLRTMQPDSKWILKSPMHSLFLPTIFSQWPFATVIRVKRDKDAATNSAIKFFSHLRALSIPGVHQHAADLESWVGIYLAEHDRRVDQAEADGYRVVTIDSGLLRTSPQFAVGLIQERISADVHA